MLRTREPVLFVICFPLQSSVRPAQSEGTKCQKPRSHGKQQERNFFFVEFSDKPEFLQSPQDFDDRRDQWRKDIESRKDLTPLLNSEPELVKLLKNELSQGRKVPLIADAEPVEVLYEDDMLLAVNKPAFLRFQPIHRWAGGSLVNRVVNYLGREPHVLHRLDMQTSGVALFAKDAATAAILHKQFRERSVSKHYVALVAGLPDSDDFEVDAPIERDPSHKYRRMVRPDGRPARTRFHVVERYPLADMTGSPLCGGGGDWRRGLGAAMVECFPETGRTHQIRVHLQYCGHPILGDEEYGVAVPYLSRQALHARCLLVSRPQTSDNFTAPSSLCLDAPYPDDLVHAISVLQSLS